MADLYDKHHKLAATWIPTKDYQMLQQLADSNKVTLAAYLRAIIVDVIQDENCITQATIATNHQVV